MKLKRLGTLLLTAIIAATTLAGCGAMPSTGNGNETGENASVIAATEEDPNGQITLRVVDWSDGSATQREEFHKKFEEAHPDIKIEYTMLTVDQFKNTIVTMIKSGEGPDLFPIPVGLTLNTAVEEGWFQPINDYVTDEFRNKFDPDAFAEGVTDIGDDWYTVTEQMPIIQCLFFYNKDILNQAGVTEVPTTYSEFREACKKVTEMGNGNVYGLIDGGKQMNRMDVMARSLAAAAGGKVAATQKVLTDNGVAPYDSKEMNDALGFIKGLVDDGSIHPDTINISAPEARELFAQGQAAFLCQGMWCVSQWDANYPDLNYGVMAVPSTKCFCIKTNNIITGITAIEPPAAMPVQSTVFSPLNAYNPTASVLDDGLFKVNTKGSMNAFQAQMVSIMTTVVATGLHSFIII
jgi:multiple sugar transport system substrate-binding protein